MTEDRVEPVELETLLGVPGPLMTSPRAGSDPYVSLPWRVGSQVCRTLYVDHGDGQKAPEQLFGLVDTAGLAAHIVELHNAWLADRG